jgi:hypothetical protein
VGSGYTENSFYTRVSSSGGYLYLYRYIDSDRVSLATVASVFSDGVEHQIDIVPHGSLIKVYVDNVLKVDVVDTNHLTNAAGVITNDLVTNDLVLTTHPSPALGLATDRIIAPQAADAATMKSDALVYIRDLTLPSSGTVVYDFRRTDNDNRISFQPKYDGNVLVYEVFGGVNIRITGDPGDILDGDDVSLVLDDAFMEAFAEGATLGSYATLTLPEAITALAALPLAGGGSAGSLELWPLRIDFPFKIVR